jgi:hypothetical protein
MMLSAMKVNLDDPQQGVVLSLPSLVRIPGVYITLKEAIYNFLVISAFWFHIINDIHLKPNLTYKE